MADREIKITFPEKKMEALVFFLGEQNEKIEEVLTAHLDKTYEKYVPQQVRKFVDSRSLRRRRKRRYQCQEHSGRQENQGRQGGGMPDRAQDRMLPEKRHTAHKAKSKYRRMSQSKV